MTLIASAPAESRRPRITNPVSGSVYAIDPDIPIDRQRLAVAVTGDAMTHRLLLDKQDLGDAEHRAADPARAGAAPARLARPRRQGRRPGRLHDALEPRTRLASRNRGTDLSPRRDAQRRPGGH